MANKNNYKGGRFICGQGYVWILKPGHPHATYNKSYVCEHRLIIEEELGRLLTKDEIVHHIDGNKQNNIRSNLLLMLRRDHARMHGYKPKIKIQCSFCGKDIYRTEKSLRFKKHFCNISCKLGRSVNGKLQVSKTCTEGSSPSLPAI